MNDVAKSNIMSYLNRPGQTSKGVDLCMFPLYMRSTKSVQ